MIGSSGTPFLGAALGLPFASSSTTGVSGRLATSCTEQSSVHVSHLMQDMRSETRVSKQQLHREHVV